MKPTTETVIIGAGMAGLGCAHTLRKAGRPFRLISENIGGRVRTSADGRVNYGAIIVTDDYDHVLPYVTKGPRIRLSELRIYGKTASYPLIGLELFKHVSGFLKIRAAARRFRRAYASLRVRSEHVSQSEAIQADPYLKKLTEQTAAEFVADLGAEAFCNRFLCEGIYTFTFANTNRISAFVYLHFIQLIVVPFYFFTVREDLLYDPIRPHLTIDRVTDVSQVDGLYRVKTDKETLFATNVVVATPLDVSRQLLGFTGGKDATEAHVFHVRGTIRPAYASASGAFFEPEPIFGFIRQPDQSYIVYARVANPDLRKYFLSFDLIATTSWPQAEFVLGHDLLESVRGKNLYLAGDADIAGMEDAFISGVFAANQIISSYG